MADAIIISGPLKPSEMNCPTRVGELVNSLDEIQNIEAPRVGMRVFVSETRKSYVILSLKERLIEGITVENAMVDDYEEVPDRGDIEGILEDFNSAFYSESSLSFSKGALQKNSNPYSGTNYNAYSELIAQPFKFIVSDAYYISRVKGVDAEGVTQVWTTYTKNNNIKEYSASDSLTYQIEIARVDAATFTDYSDVVEFFGVDKAAKNAASIEELKTQIKGLQETDKGVSSNIAKLMNRVFPLEVSLTLSKTIKEKGVSEDVRVSWTVKREGVTIVPTSVQLYDGKSTIDVTGESSTTVNISDTTIFSLTVEADGLTVTKSATISAYNLTYYGIGNSVNDIVPGGTSKLTASAKGNYTVTSVVGKSFILAVPSGVTAPSSFAMGGAPATLAKSNATINGVIYTVFTSAVATVAATGTYIAN